MKNFFIIFIALASISMKSQSVIIDITKSGAGQPNDYYRKDFNNLLDNFQGTYLYSNGNTSLKIVLKKMIKQSNGSHYEDLIVGEYQYVENGTERINTLSNLNVTYSNEFLKHSIAGSSVIPSNTFLWTCQQCNASEKVLRTTFRDKISDRSADFFIRRKISSGQDILQVKICNVSAQSINVNNPEPSQLPFALPVGEFTLIKQ